MSAVPNIKTPITEMFNIKHPVMLAGMNIAASPELAAAVTNAGGLGVFGGVTYKPKIFRAKIQEIKENLKDPKAPFGVDLLIPQVGGSARKTNYDYTHGDLPELIDITIEEGAALFVCAVGVPPAWAVEKLHKAGIPVMNMIGSPNHVKKALDAGVDIICAQGGEGGGVEKLHKAGIPVMNMIGSPNHVKKALDAGVDIICAQGGEGGGHTGEVGTSILIPMVVDLCKGKLSPLTGKQVPVVAAGGIFDGRGLAMALSLGADGVWVGTRFIASVEGGAPKKHKEEVCKAGVHDTHRALVYTGRPMRIIKNKYSVNWEQNRAEELKDCLASGILPILKDQKIQQQKNQGELKDVPAPPFLEHAHPWLCGQVAGAFNDILPAQTIVESMVTDAARQLQALTARVSKL
eukprot:CAMPEP_0194782352 /NCGR_PEP_ID=MMETSP0323_2-20130528/78641_1 /TAXON_ID=2866 ORGANISM="Crypthecodinium cohnii, Strain Seligo" /NCGR_SAMPLE_ID=MMETSP0323_2 /ASSEMBLY_ACC=CAM_ASM_000346 /LENGTH=404 /DNA_ID=CAMNT_0039721159 /DNA_START=59 /DNA_END=1274 /DNA_ORIENTATION=-